MADELIKKRVYDVLKKGFFNDPDDLVDVSDGSADLIHVVVVSRKFDGRDLKEKNDMIWDELFKRLTPEEWGQVTLTNGVSVEEIKTI